MATEAAARPDGQPGDVRRRPWEPLRSRNYRFFAACDVISALGSAVSFIALPFAVLRIGGSATDVGLVATAETVPFAAFLLHGGVIADRLPRQRVMVAATVASGHRAGRGRRTCYRRAGSRVGADGPGRRGQHRRGLFLSSRPGPPAADGAACAASASQRAASDREQPCHHWRLRPRRPASGRRPAQAGAWRSTQ